MEDRSTQQRIKILGGGIALLFTLIFVATKLTISPHISYSLPPATATPFIIAKKVASATPIPPTPTASFPPVPTELIPEPEVQIHQPVTTAGLDYSKVFQRDYFMAIPKLNVYAPILPNVNGSNKDEYLRALINGVAHFSGTSLPGETGNSFIFGHSSYYTNREGYYKNIFATLHNLDNGDPIYLWYEGKEYIYYVAEEKIVQPTDLSVLDQTDDERITLQACWPIGSTKERIIIVAKRG